jgi:hypothetical protein
MVRSRNITEEATCTKFLLKTSQQGTALAQMDTMKMITGSDSMNLTSVITDSI